MTQGQKIVGHPDAKKKQFNTLNTTPTKPSPTQAQARGAVSPRTHYQYDNYVNMIQRQITYLSVGPI